jgi:hypothetical protein
MSYRVHLKTDSVHLDLSEVLPSEPIVLAGVLSDFRQLASNLGAT